MDCFHVVSSLQVSRVPPVIHEERGRSYYRKAREFTFCIEYRPGLINLWCLEIETRQCEVSEVQLQNRHNRDNKKTIDWTIINASDQTD
jgi:hypothetical protein